MNQFVLILNKLLPLYFLIAAGFIIGRTFSVKWDAISILLIYVITPVALPANSVAFAMALKIEAKQVATAVLASTLFVLFYIPLVSKWLLA